MVAYRILEMTLVRLVGTSPGYKDKGLSVPLGKARLKLTDFQV